MEIYKRELLLEKMSCITFFQILKNYFEEPDVDKNLSDFHIDNNIGGGYREITYFKVPSDNENYGLCEFFLKEDFCVRIYVDEYLNSKIEKKIINGTVCLFEGEYEQLFKIINKHLEKKELLKKKNKRKKQIKKIIKQLIFCAIGIILGVFVFKTFILKLL